MLVAVLGFVSALIYGTSDFFGGLAARRMSPLLTTMVTFLAADIAVVVAVAVSNPTWTWLDLTLGLIAGAAGAVAYWAFYAALAAGPMSVLSPAVAVLYAVLPAIVGIANGERFPLIGYVALGVVVVAAVLLGVSRTPDGRRLTLRALLLALVAGVGFAAYVILIDFTSPASGMVPLFADYVAATVVIGAILAVARVRGGRAVMAGVRDRRALLLAVGAGVLLAVANILLVVGLHLGDLAVMGVLNSLYPLSTVVLAMVFLRERLSLWQWVGVVLGLVGAAALAVV